MVTHNATVLEQRLLTGESPPPAATVVAATTSTAVPREDPMSHRIIEKRRRDRMNNCLADLSRLIPAEYLKKGRGRIEKTEIIEMAIRHMKHLQSHACRHGDQCNGGGGAPGAGTGASAGAGGDLSQQPSPEEPSDQPPSGGGGGGGTGGPIVLEHYRLGYQECLSEAMHFLVEVEGFFAGDPLCVQLINHLQRHCDRILKGDRLNYPRTHLGETTSSSGSSCGSGRGRVTATAGGGTGGGGGCNSSGGLCSSGLGSASASGSSPGSCSDSGRLEPAPQPPREVGPGRRSGGGGGATLASLATLGRHEEMQAHGGSGSYDEPPPPGQQQPLGSQLRDMLTGAQMQDRRCLGEVLTCNVGSSSMQSRQLDGVGSAPPGLSVIHGTAPPPAHPQSQLKHHQHHHNPHHAPPPPMAHPLMQPYAAASPGPVPSDGTPVSLYKFKNNIKQRFSAEHVHGGTETPGGAAAAAYAKRRRYACDSDDAMCGAGSGGGLLSLSVRRRDSETCSVPSPPASPPPPRGAYGPGMPLPGGPGVARSPSPASSPVPNNFSQAPGGPAPPPSAYSGSPPRPVPVFALHARGAYYMPLTLDSDVLAPFVDCACEGGTTAADAGPGPVALHPVTISVNFTRSPFVCSRMAVPRHVSTWKADPGTPWKTDSGTPWKTEPGTFGAPRWPECAPDRG